MTKTQDDTETRLQKIAQANGGLLTPADVVEDARHPKSPLHCYFEWDDAAAAHAYRIDQARVLIRSVRCEVSIMSTTIAAPYYVRDPRTDHGYVAISQVRRDKDLARDVMRDEMGRVIAAMERARCVSDELDLTADLDRLVAAIREIRHRAAPKAA